MDEWAARCYKIGPMLSLCISHALTAFACRHCSSITIRICPIRSSNWPLLVSCRAVSFCGQVKNLRSVTSLSQSLSKMKLQEVLSVYKGNKMRRFWSECRESLPSVWRRPLLQQSHVCAAQYLGWSTVTACCSLASLQLLVMPLPYSVAALDFLTVSLLFCP